MRLSRRLFAAVVATLILCGAAAAAPGASAEVRLAPVTRLPFPERGYVLHVPDKAKLDAGNVAVRENGLRVTGVRVFFFAAGVIARTPLRGRPASSVP